MLYICRNASNISHMLFADDCFIFMRAKEEEARVVHDLLHKYEIASGQSINLGKSNILFSKNVAHATRTMITDFLGVNECARVSKYLGLPAMIGRNKKEIFNFVRDHVWKRLNSWKGKTLSMAGREILLKSVAQAIPTYCMSMYLIPQSLGDDIQKMLNSFWWGSSSRQLRGIKWMNWDKLSVPKKHGGMAFRNIYGFNFAMLRKQAWKFIDQPDTLVSRLFKARYY